MRNLIFLSLFALFSCSDLSTEENELAGHWEWSAESGGFGDKGFLKLEADRDVTFFQESWNPSERKIFNRGELRFGWKIDNDKLCMATEWQGREFLNQECQFSIKRTIDDKLIIVVDAMFIRNAIKLSRVE